LVVKKQVLSLQPFSLMSSFLKFDDDKNRVVFECEVDGF